MFQIQPFHIWELLVPDHTVGQIPLFCQGNCPFHDLAADFHIWLLVYFIGEAVNTPCFQKLNQPLTAKKSPPMAGNRRTALIDFLYQRLPVRYPLVNLPLQNLHRQAGANAGHVFQAIDIDFRPGIARQGFRQAAPFPSQTLAGFL